MVYKDAVQLMERSCSYYYMYCLLLYPYQMLSTLRFVI